MILSTVASVSALLLFPTAIIAVDDVVNASLVAQLKLSATGLERMKLLPQDSDWIYDFTKNPKYTFDPGSVCNANVATFPALTGLGMTLAMLNLGACSMLPPHLHRATNLVVAVSGSTNTYMIQENGARVVQATLTPGMMTIFPQASMHMMVNNGCTPSQLISALSSEDPGTLNILNNLWEMPEDIITRLLDLDDFNQTGSTIPIIGTGSNSGTQACLARCQAQGMSYGANQTRRVMI